MFRRRIMALSASNPGQLRMRSSATASEISRVEIGTRIDPACVFHKRLQPRPIRRPTGVKATPHPVDFFAILVAGVASIVIIINAVFLQSGYRPGIDEPQMLASTLQKPQEFLKSEGERLQRKIDSALAAIKIVETLPGARRGR
jgi:hypothetical protein